MLAAAAVPWSDGPLRRLAGGDGDGPDPTFDVELDADALRAAAPLVGDSQYADGVAGRLAAAAGEPQGGRDSCTSPAGCRVLERARAEWIVVGRDGRVVVDPPAMSLVAGVLVLNAAFLAAGYALLGPARWRPSWAGVALLVGAGSVGTLVFFATIVGLHASLAVAAIVTAAARRRWVPLLAPQPGARRAEPGRVARPVDRGRVRRDRRGVHRRRRRRLSLRAVARRRLGDLAAEGPRALAPRARRAAVRAERRVRDVRRAGLSALVVGGHEPRRAGRRRPRRARRVRAARAADGRVRRSRRAAALGLRPAAGAGRVAAPARPLPRALAARSGRRRRPPARDLPRARRGGRRAVAADARAVPARARRARARGRAADQDRGARRGGGARARSERSSRGASSGSRSRSSRRCRGSRGGGCTTCRAAPSST